MPHWYLWLCLWSVALCCIKGLGTLAAGPRPAVGTFPIASVLPATERMASQGRANKIKCVQGQGRFQSELAVLEARVLDLTPIDQHTQTAPQGLRIGLKLCTVTF